MGESRKFATVVEMRDVPHLTPALRLELYAAIKPADRLPRIYGLPARTDRRPWWRRLLDVVTTRRRP